MAFDILHLSDLHFGNPEAHLRRREIDAAFDALLSQLNGPNSLVVISGDITFKGQQKGYDEAKDVIVSAINRRKISKTSVLVCPGNHDVVEERASLPYFTSFDAWSTGLRSDKRCTFAGNPVRLVENEAGTFLLVNSAYHANYAFGHVSLSHVEGLLQKLSPPEPGKPLPLRVAITHHHVIPVLDEDTSTTRNAYSFIKLLERYGFSALLHGHQHAMLHLQVGQGNMLVSGIGSPTFSTPGYMNTAAIYRGEDGAIEQMERFGLSLDSHSGIFKVEPVNKDH